MTKIKITEQNFDKFLEFTSKVSELASKYFNTANETLASHEDTKDNNEVSFEYKFSLTDKLFDEYAR